VAGCWRGTRRWARATAISRGSKLTPTYQQPSAGHALGGGESSPMRVPCTSSIGLSEVTTAGQGRLSVECGVFPQECNPPIPLALRPNTRRSPRAARCQHDLEEKRRKGAAWVDEFRAQTEPGSQLVCNPGNWPFPKQRSAHLNATPAQLQSASRHLIGRLSRQAQTVGVGVGGLCVPICPPRFSGLAR
jgi:hypothetical protein